MKKCKENLIDKRIENCVNYFVEKTKDESKFKFSSSWETSTYDGRSFHEMVGEPMVKGYYKWCAVNIKHELVIYWTCDSLNYFKSRFNDDPPAYCFVLDNVKSDRLSKADKAQLDKIYDEICLKIHGMNDKIQKMFKQAEQQFVIEQDMDSLFSFIEPVKEQDA